MGTGCYRFKFTSPVVSWRGWETPPPPPSTAAQLLFFAQPRLGEDLSLRGGLLLRRLLLIVYVWWMDWILFDIVSEYFLPFIFRLCQGSYEYVQGWGTENVVLFCRLWKGIPTPLVLGVGGALQALFPLRSRPLPARKLLREFRTLGLLLPLPSL